MAFDTELITSTQVITETIPDSSFDTERLDKFILPSQRHYLRPFFGDDMYNTLLTEKVSGFSTENQTLYDSFLIPLLSWYTLYDALPQIRNHITPRGIMVNDTEFSQQSSKEDYSGLRNHALAQAERWKKDTKQYISDEQDDDSTKYADFKNCTPPNTNKYGFIVY